MIINSRQYIRKITKLFQIYKQGNKWNSNGHGQNTYKLDLSHEHGLQTWQR
jgi:hypothetical protein